MKIFRFSSLTLSLVALLFCSCASMHNVSQASHNESHSDSTAFVQHRSDVKHDSIFVRDSVVIWQKNDTVKIEKWHTKHIEKTVFVTDTVVQTLVVTDVKTDSIYIEQVKEKPLKCIDSLRLKCFDFVCILLIVCVFVLVMKSRLKSIFEQ